MILYIVYTILIFVVSMILLYLFYQNYLIGKNQIYAYIIELRNKNKDILIQTKVKLIKREKIHTLKAKIDDCEVTVIVNSPVPEDIKSIEHIYWDKGTNKYYTSENSSNDTKCMAKIIEESLYYKYKLRDREDTFIKESKNIFISQEQVVFKNPFTCEYFWESEIDGREVITEIDLMNKIPKKLDIYFFNNKEMKKILDLKRKDNESVFGIFSIISGAIALISFVSFLLF